MARISSGSCVFLASFLTKVLPVPSRWNLCPSPSASNHIFPGPSSESGSLSEKSIFSWSVSSHMRCLRMLSFLAVPQKRGILFRGLGHHPFHLFCSGPCRLPLNFLVQVCVAPGAHRRQMPDGRARLFQRATRHHHITDVRVAKRMYRDAIRVAWRVQSRPLDQQLPSTLHFFEVARCRSLAWKYPRIVFLAIFLPAFEHADGGRLQLASVYLFVFRFGFRNGPSRQIRRNVLPAHSEYVASSLPCR